MLLQKLAIDGDSLLFFTVSALIEHRGLPVLLQRLVAQAPCITDKVAVDPVVFARPETIDLLLFVLLFAVVDEDIASFGTAMADRGGRCEEPDPLRKTEIFAGQRTDRTEIDDIHRVGVVELSARHRRDTGMVASADDTELMCSGDLGSEARTAGTEYAALLVEHHIASQIDMFFVLYLL